MKTTLILQANGNKLRATLKSISHPTQLRIATAYVSGTTTSILRTFATTRKVLLVDYDARCLTERVLSKLLTLSHCSVFLADIAETFHPKVYILDTPTHMHLFIGSNNATQRWRRFFGHEIGTRYVMTPRWLLLSAALSSILDFCATCRLAVLNATPDRVSTGP